MSRLQPVSLCLRLYASELLSDLFPKASCDRFGGNGANCWVHNWLRDGIRRARVPVLSGWRSSVR